MLRRLFGYPDSSSREYGRLEAFSDSVFTIAITLLGFQLVVPTLDEPVTDGQLWRALLDNWPAYVSFLLSFFSTLIMWINHHAIFRVMESVDQTITFANGFLLMLVTAVPFVTENLAAYLNTGAAEVAAAIYAGCSSSSASPTTCSGGGSRGTTAGSILTTIRGRYARSRSSSWPACRST